MNTKIVLISDDLDFFEYISPKLALRKSDELFKFSFDKVTEKIHLLLNSVIIINSENSENKTLELLKIIKGTPSIIFAFNENDEFKLKIYNSGAFAYITPLVSDEEFQAKLIPALTTASTLEKNNKYREMLVRSNLITQNNEVFIDYQNLLDKELETLNLRSESAVLVAIAPNEKTKFLLQANQIETIILNNIRKNDLLMTYAPNKYFLLLYNTNIETAEQIWEKIKSQIPEKIYAGFASTNFKTRQQLINEVLNNLHVAINYNKEYIKNSSDLEITSSNFKVFRQEFNKKIQKVIIPVFYHAQQKYNSKLFGMKIEQMTNDNSGVMTIQGRNSSGIFKITCPGFSKINIDITYQSKNNIPPKRINIEPNELEAGLLEDLLEQFITEFKKEVNNDNT